jgi:hypothetical protein
MRFTHHDLFGALDDEWWFEAGMAGFSPGANAYRTDPSLSINGEPILAVRIADVGPIGPVRRSIGIFRDSEDGIPARERVLQILRGFRLGHEIPPVQVVECVPSSQYRYKLTDGTHRFYCSVAAGFTHIPTIRGFDRNPRNDIDGSA